MPQLRLIIKSTPNYDDYKPAYPVNWDAGFENHHIEPGEKPRLVGSGNAKEWHISVIHNKTGQRRTYSYHDRSFYPPVDTTKQRTLRDRIALREKARDRGHGSLVDPKPMRKSLRGLRLTLRKSVSIGEKADSKMAASNTSKSTFVKGLRLYLRKSVSGGLPASHPLAKTLADNNSRMLMKNETHAGNSKLLQSSMSRQPKNQDTSDKLVSTGAIVKPAYDKLIGDIGREHNFHETSNWNPNEKGRVAKEITKGHKAGGIVVYAPLKAKEKIDKNANDKFLHNKNNKNFRPDTDVHGRPGYNRITDVVRGSIGVPHRADLPHVMDSLRKRLNHPDSEFELAEEPKDNFSHPKSTGYSDFNIRLRHKKTGHVSELQLHTLDMLHSKDSPYGSHDIAGHAYYDAQTDINNPKKNPKSLDHETLEGHQRHLYGHEVLSNERTRHPSIEKNPTAIGLANEHIRMTNHTVHDTGKLLHPNGSIVTKKMD